MSINDIIIYIMLIFMVVGVVDKLAFKDKFGYGPQFEEGILAMGTLAMSMVGIMCFAPVLGSLLEKPVGAVFSLVGANPAMFAGSILANDMGGYALSKALTDDVQIQHLSGLIMGAMMGATIVFSIPVSLGIVDESDRPYLAKGMLAGFIAIPFGAFVGGLVDGIPAGIIIVNLIPSIVLAILFAIGLALIPNGMMKGFMVFAKVLTIFITVFFALAIIRELSGLEFGFMKDMDPIGPQLETCGVIAITLAGAFPFVHFITSVLGKPLSKVGKLIGVNDSSIAGMIACLANNIPMFGMMKDMDPRGKILAVAFSVCASFALGDHLGFTAGQDQSAIAPMVSGKLVGGIVGVIVAILLVTRGVPKYTGKDDQKAPAAEAAAE